MAQSTPTNGRVTIAIVGTKVDSLTAIVLNTNATVDDMRRELGEMRQELAVNAERWRSHDKAQAAAIEAHDKADVQRWEAHGSVHTRENRVIAAISSSLGAASGYISAMFNR